jgi:hypothetical protein
MTTLLDELDAEDPSDEKTNDDAGGDNDEKHFVPFIGGEAPWGQGG